MAVHERAYPNSCRVRIVNGVAQAIVDRFVVRQTATPGAEEFITFVPTAAAGGYPDGILAMKADVANAPNPGTGYAVTSYIPANNGGEVIIELAEVAAQGVLLRAGGLGGEVDGAAYLADATGDIAIMKTAEAGVVGQKVRAQWIQTRIIP